MRLAILSTTLTEEPWLPTFTRFAEKAREEGHDCALVRHGELALTIGERDSSVWGEGAERIDEADLVIPKLSLRRITRGDAYVLDHLEARGVPFLNPVAALLVARSKVTTLQILVRAGLPVPRTVVVRRTELLGEAIRRLGPGPWVVKPSTGSKGRDITLARDLEALERDLAERWESDRHEIHLLQPLLKTVGDRPWDLRVFVLLGEVLGAMRRDAVEGDFRANFSLGGAVSPVRLAPDLARLAVSAAEALGLEMAGVDLLISQEGPVLLEVNANPGWEGISEALAAEGRDFPVEFLARIGQRFGNHS